MSKIEWTERSWNPIVGCAIVSPGCTNCYAMRTAHRLGQNPATPQYAGLTKVVNAKPVWTGEMRLHEPALDLPLRTRKPTTWFVNSMSDLFAEGVQEAWLDEVFIRMCVAESLGHTFQILTKRPDRARAYLTTVRDRLYAVGNVFGRWPLPNVWLGVSAEDQRRADERIPVLLATPAAVRFVSIEPMLGPIDLTSIQRFQDSMACKEFIDSLRGTFWTDQTGLPNPDPKWAKPGVPFNMDYDTHSGLNWVIVGGESGPGARPMHPDWVRQIRDHCAAASVPFFFKQWGEWAVHLDRDRDDDDWRADYRRLEIAPYRWLNLKGGIGFHGERFHVMRRDGKKAAGRLLDGQLHDGMPQ